MFRRRRRHVAHHDDLAAAMAGAAASARAAGAAPAARVCLPERASRRDDGGGLGLGIAAALLFALVLAWRAAAGGWASGRYAGHVLVGLALSLASDLLLNEPVEERLTFVAFACALLAACSYAAALSSSSAALSAARGRGRRGAVVT